MLLSLLPYAANLIILVVYFFLPLPHPFFDFSTVSVWPIVVFVLFAVLEVLAFSLQETTRQLVRIYLLQKSGVGYDDSLLPVYQLKLTPNWTVPIIPIYIVSQVASFALLLFSFGWGAAVSAHVIAYALTIWIPIPYALFMPSIKTHLARSSEMEKLVALTEGFDTERFMSLIDEALSEKKNMGDWWAKLLLEKIADQDKINQKRESASRESIDHGDTIVDVEGRKQAIQVEFFDLAEEAFETGHKMVGFRNMITKEVGPFWSTRSVDYTPFVGISREIQSKACQLENDVETFLASTSDCEKRFLELLRRHVRALHQYSDFLVEQAEFMYKKSKSVSAPGTSWSNWWKLFKTKEQILKECQSSGAELTLYYHEMNEIRKQGGGTLRHEAQQGSTL